MEPEVRVEQPPKMINKLFRLNRIVALAAVIFGMVAVYYFISRRDDASLEDGIVSEGDLKYMLDDQHGGVLLDVYYESLCPDSRSFFLNELLPTVHKLNQHLKVNLIPYGRAETMAYNGRIDFKCQHGQPECFGNKIHACAIQKSLTDTALSVNLTSCLFEEYFQPSSGERCCQKYGISWSDVKNCANGEEGSKLLQRYGDLTNALLPIDFIPTIAINKVRGSKSYQAAILKDLTQEVCKVLKKSHNGGCAVGVVLITNVSQGFICESSISGRNAM